MDVADVKGTPIGLRRMGSTLITRITRTAVPINWPLEPGELE